MQTTEIVTLYDYNYWANHLILDAAAQLTPEEYLAPLNYSWGGVHSTLTHILAAETAWRQRCQDGFSPPNRTAEEFSSLEALVETWRDEETAMRAYVASLSEADLAGPVHYKNAAGKAFAVTQWRLLTHVVFHGMQHRSEVAIMLTNYGHSPGGIDMSKYNLEYP